MTCTCPPNPAGWWSCTDCPEHGEAANEAGEREHAAEIAAERAWWLRQEYDPRMDDPREW